MNEADEQGSLRWRVVCRANELAGKLSATKAELGQEVEEMHEALLWQVLFSTMWIRAMLTFVDACAGLMSWQASCQRQRLSWARR